jgi:hypothetical protein
MPLQPVCGKSQESSASPDPAPIFFLPRCAAGALHSPEGQEVRRFASSTREFHRIKTYIYIENTIFCGFANFIELLCRRCCQPYFARTSIPHSCYGSYMMTCPRPNLWMHLFPGPKRGTNGRRLPRQVCANGVLRHGMVCLLHWGKASLS